MLEKTLKHAAQEGLRARLLHPWYDVDTPEDLHHLARDLSADTATARALEASPQVLEH